VLTLSPLCTGYYRDNRYSRTFYTKKEMTYQLQRKPRLDELLWGREFSKAHADIDDYWSDIPKFKNATAVTQGLRGGRAG
jgi:hypothetical protein